MSTNSAALTVSDEAQAPRLRLVTPINFRPDQGRTATSTKNTRASKPKLRTDAPTQGNKSTSSSPSLSCASDVGLLLANPEVYKTYFVGKHDTAKYKTVGVPAMALCLSSSIQIIGRATQDAGGNYASANTVGCLLVHLGLLSLDTKAETEELKAACGEVNRSLKSLRSWQESFLVALQNGPSFTLPAGRQKTITLTVDVDDRLSTLCGALGLTKGVLAACAMAETLSYQPQHMSADNASIAQATARDFLKWMTLKARVIRTALEEALRQRGGQ